MKHNSHLVLASSSPRRKSLMIDAGMDPIIISPDAEEIMTGDPVDIVVENAIRKALSADGPEDSVVIGCDTIGQCNGEILGKPIDIDDARRMLLLQQDHPCKVISGVAVHDVKKKRTFQGFEISIVEMDGGKEGVEEYLASGQWEGKAGSFGIQDRGPIGAKVVSGEEDNVMGLPMELLERLLSLVGFEYPERTPSE